MKERDTMMEPMTLGRYHAMAKRDDEIAKTRWKLSNLKRKLQASLDEIEEFEVSRRHSGYYVGVKFNDGKPISSVIFHEEDQMVDEIMERADVLIPLCKQEDYKEFEGF